MKKVCIPTWYLMFRSPKVPPRFGPNQNGWSFDQPFVICMGLKWGGQNSLPDQFRRKGGAGSGRHAKPWGLVYRRLYKSQIPIADQALEKAATSSRAKTQHGSDPPKAFRVRGGVCGCTFECRTGRFVGRSE
jgi:hypothetical protein